MLQIRNILRTMSGLAGLCMLVGVINAHAANLTINTTADAGIGSLRQALIDANTNGEANIVTFNIPTADPGYDLGQNRFTITLLGPLPNIPLAPMTITNGQSQAITVKGDSTFRIFTLVNSAVVIINNLTISEGFSSDGLGGGIFLGDSGVLTLNGCTVGNNSVAGNGGGIYISNSATLHLNQSTVRSNSAASGGGIFINDSGTLNMNASTVNGNVATDGGGIYNGTSGTINANSSTLSGNSAASRGGGLYNTATFTAVNNTFAGNSADLGGGIYNAFTATLTNNIIALNTAAAGNDVFGGGALGGNAYTGTYNLIGNADDSVGLASAPNRSGTTANPIDPMLGPLENNGGPTFTRALLLGSPALDKGSSPTIITDQRGRPVPSDDPLIPNDGGNGADMGSFERQFAASAGEVAVGGRVMISYGKSYQGLPKATVTLTGMNGVVHISRTSPLGYFQFYDVQGGTTYVVSVKHKSYQFSPHVINLVDELTSLEFVNSY